MKRILLLIVISLFSFKLFSADRNEAYRLICSKLPFESDRTSCTQTIKNFEYFDSRALTICDKLSFNSSKLECLEKIGNKYYEEFEIDLCLKENFDSSKISCLYNNGRIHRKESNCLKNNEVIYEINASLLSLRNRETRSAELRLQDLVYKLNSCKP